MKKLKLFTLLLLLYSGNAFCLSNLIFQSLAYNQSTGLWTGVVKNIGVDRTPTGVTIGAAWHVDGNKVGFSYKNFPTSGLAAGGTFTFSFSYNLGDLTTHSYNLKAIIDDVNRITESNEGDNETNINVGSPATSVDLIVTALTYEDGVYTATVKNNGTAATPADKNIGVAYYVDGVYKTWGSSAFSTPGSLAAGASVVIGTEQNDTTAGSFIIPQGTHSVKVTADRLDAIEESNETNNDLTISVNIGDTTDPSTPTGLVVTPISDTQLNLSWAASTDNVGVDHYNVYRNGVAIAAPTGTTYNNTGLTENTTYLYYVTSEDAAGNESANSVKVSGTTATTVAQPVNVSSAPAAINGSNTVDIRYTQNLPQPPGAATASSGKIRLKCKVAHVGFVDPIVYPNQSGNTGHLHTFLGNDSVTNSSTAATMKTVGGSTCVGGAANKSGYWVPTMYDKRNGNVVPLTQALIYYSSEPVDRVRLTVQQLPNGLKMVAGDSKSSTPGTFNGFYECLNYAGGTYSQGDSIPTNCQANHVVRWKLIFPDCWDGKNTDSANHKSHMAEAVDFSGNGCPDSHPIRVPAIAFIFDFKVNVANESQYWRLSSDMYNVNSPGGYSGHGDVFEAWDDFALQSVIDNCIKPGKDCGTTLLGNNKELFFK